jgi:hypothetical protein
MPQIVSRRPIAGVCLLVRNAYKGPIVFSGLASHKKIGEKWQYSRHGQARGASVAKFRECNKWVFPFGNIVLHPSFRFDWEVFVADAQALVRTRLAQDLRLLPSPFMFP